VIYAEGCLRLILLETNKFLKTNDVILSRYRRIYNRLSGYKLIMSNFSEGEKYLHINCLIQTSLFFIDKNYTNIYNQVKYKNI